MYENKIKSDLKGDLGLENALQSPRIEKVVLNMGVGEAKENQKDLEESLRDLRLIAGQQPSTTEARRSISDFNLRKGVPIGCKVTLRGRRMYEFLDKLFNIVFPRTKDFRGLDPQSFDGQGNYSIGLQEQTAFPEIDTNRISKLRGLQITIVTTAEDDRTAEILLRKMGCPLKQETE